MTGHRALRPLLRTALAFLAAGLAATAGPFLAPGMAWSPGHGWLLAAGFLLPALAMLHLHVLHTVGRPLAARPAVVRLAAAYGTGAGVTGLASVLQPSSLFSAVLVAGIAVLAAAAVLQARTVGRLLPRRSAVDIDRDPLTKGDDASFAHVRFAHRFLPLGLAALAVAWSFPADAWAGRLAIAASHLVWIGYGLLSLYGLGHLVVPRLSGVPAIAAGAIKGELHTTLLGIVGVLAGFAFDVPGLIAGFGAVVFLGFFVYMGVLGANMMRRKSRTQRVTPEFVYIPWTFTGIFWLVSGVLMGIFLQAVPDVWAERARDLRFLHIHVNLFGGFALLWCGWLTRLLPAAEGRPPPGFRANRGAFYLLNLSLVVAIAAVLADGVESAAAGPWLAVAASFALAGTLVFIISVKGLKKRPAMA